LYLLKIDNNQASISHYRTIKRYFFIHFQNQIFIKWYTTKVDGKFNLGNFITFEFINFCHF